MLCACAVLLVSLRGAPLGTAVADDYSFLARLHFHPLRLFDSMGGAFYWRPVSRQLYFALVGRALPGSPWIPAGVHAVLLLALAAVMYGIARRGLSRSAAGAVAAFPLASEAARVLLAWPSGAQHLLASLGAALALREALAGRWATMAAAAFAGVLSHESAALVLPALPAVAALGGQRPAGIRRAWVAVASVALVWGAGYAIALGHGVRVPESPAGFPWAALPATWARAAASALDLEDLAEPVRALLGAAYVALALVAGAGAARGRARGRLRAATPASLATLGLFLLGTLPLAALPDWNAWRAWVPAVLMGGAVTALLGLVSPWLAGSFAALRLVALLLHPVAPATATALPPDSASQMSFPRLVRLQRVVESTRRALRTSVPRIRPGATVRYWYLPRLAEFGFQGAAALQVWYGDPTLSWEAFGGDSGYARTSDALVEYAPDVAWPAAVDEPEAFALNARARTLMEQGRYAAADSVLAAALARHARPIGPFRSVILQNQARVAFSLRDFARADSLNRISRALLPGDADGWELEARLALVRGDPAGAIEALRRCLSINPRHRGGRELAALLTSRH